jgi:hypothetical protein
VRAKIRFRWWEYSLLPAGQADFILITDWTALYLDGITFDSRKWIVRSGPNSKMYVLFCNCQPSFHKRKEKKERKKFYSRGK